jgi:hypothetical protein
MSHRKAKLTPFGGLLLVQRVEAYGWPAVRKQSGPGANDSGSVRTPRLPECDCRRNRHDPAVVGLDQLPPALMHLPVVAGAQQDLIFDFSSPATNPVHEMMSIAPRTRPVAVGPLAVLIAGDQGPAPRSFDHALGPTHVDHHRVLHQDAGDAAVARPALDRRG